MAKKTVLYINIYQQQHHLVDIRMVVVVHSSGSPVNHSENAVNTYKNHHIQNEIRRIGIEPMNYSSMNDQKEN